MLLSVLVTGGCNSFTASGKNADGVEFYQQGQYQQALQTFQQAANTHPASPDPYYNLGRVHHRLAAMNHDPESAAQAERFYRMAIDRDANHADAHRALAVFMVEQGQTDAAFDLLEQWRTAQPDKAEARIELARLHEEFGEKNAAKEQLLEALVIDHENPRTLAALGRLRDEAGEYTQAVANYRKSLQYDQFQPEVAARVTALQGAVTPAPLYTAPGSGTRMVQTPTTLQR